MRTLYRLWVILLVGVTFAGVAAAQSTLPTMTIGTGQLISPAVGDAFYLTSTCHTYGLVDPAICRTDLPPGYQRPVDIRSAARALGAGVSSPDTYVNAVYEFILNGVDTEFRYGLAKGALGTLIDRSGTPFDQAQLMVELLAEGGVTARYQLGTITLTPAQFTAWTTLSDAKASCRLLANGGIPGIVNTTTSATCAYSGALTAITMNHAWVQVDIGG
jgi:transglutaminase-like putative cysteine protease